MAGARHAGGWPEQELRAAGAVRVDGSPPGGGVRWQLPLPGQAFVRCACRDTHVLFTDIEGSRALLRRLGEDVYAQALAGHHALMFMRAASPSSRAWRPRSNWLVRAASVIGGPAGSVGLGAFRVDRA